MFDWIANVFSKRQDMSYIFDGEYFTGDDTSQKAYLKRTALETCIDYIAKNFAQAKFQHVKKYKRLNDMVDYKLNIMPNQNENATEFWRHFLRKLIYEGEVLVIQSQTNDLLIADSFVKNESAYYPDTFSGVSIKGYLNQSTFTANDVIYCKYNNQRLETFTDSLFADYGQIFGRMLEVQMRNNQIRGTVKANLTQGTQEQKQKTLETYLEKIFKSFRDKTVAVVPLTQGFEYEELGGTKSNTAQSIDQLTKLRNDTVDIVAEMMGIPPKLIYDQPADTEKLQTQFNEGTLAFFYDLISSELNAKLISSSAYQNGERITLVGKNAKDIFSISDSIDKLVASGTFSRNEIRIDLGREPVKGLDDFVITKNYTTSIGGEKDKSVMTINEVREDQGQDPIEGGDAIYMPSSDIPSIDINDEGGDMSGS